MTDPAKGLSPDSSINLYREQCVILMTPPQIGWRYIQTFAVFGNRAPRDVQAMLTEQFAQSLVRKRFARIFCCDQFADLFFDATAGNIFAVSGSVAAGKEKFIFSKYTTGFGEEVRLFLRDCLEKKIPTNYSFNATKTQEEREEEERQIREEKRQKQLELQKQQQQKQQEQIQQMQQFQQQFEQMQQQMMAMMSMYQMYRQTKQEEEYDDDDEYEDDYEEFEDDDE